VRRVKRRGDTDNEGDSEGNSDGKICTTPLQAVLALEIEYWYSTAKVAQYTQSMPLFLALRILICYGEW